ncbi:hypothetical protein J3E68DRAFT_193687 [Trichoderma sp. SZMC 28012]
MAFLNKKVKEYLVVLSIFDNRRIVWHLQMLAMASHLPGLYHGSPRLNLRPCELLTLTPMQATPSISVVAELFASISSSTWQSEPALTPFPFILS